MMQKHVVNISTDRKNLFSQMLMIFLCLMAVVIKTLWIMGCNISVIFVHLFLIFAAISCFAVGICTLKNGKINFLISVCAVILIISTSLIQIPAAKFRFFKSTYDTIVEDVHMQVLSEKDGFYIELPKFNSWLGDVHYFKSNQGIAISFEERYTFFDCFCYVKIYSNSNIDTIIPNSQTIEDLGNKWYYINLF